MINYARFLNINPEDALERTNKKFIKRFHLESKGWRVRKAINGHDLVEMDVLGRS
jgi:XTP/dITP diphosphohydrolase